MRSIDVVAVQPVCTVHYEIHQLVSACARTPWQRFVGLLAGPPRALLLPKTGLIHTFGMRYAIDVWFLDRTGVLCHTIQNLRPWRWAGHYRARHTLELPAGLVTPPEIGTVFSWHIAEPGHGR